MLLFADLTNLQRVQVWLVAVGVELQMFFVALS
jgi:hypothetical protein